MTQIEYLEFVISQLEMDCQKYSHIAVSPALYRDILKLDIHYNPDHIRYCGAKIKQDNTLSKHGFVIIFNDEGSDK